MERKHWIIALICFAIAITILGFFFSQKEQGTKYLTEPVIRGNISQVVNATGEANAVNLVSVGAQVSGQILKLHAVLGQTVRQGDLLAEIDAVKQENQLNIDKAKLRSYETDLEAKKVELRIAQSQYNRALRLSKQDAASRESLENAERTLALTRSEMMQIESQIVQTRIAVSTDEQNLGYTRITAPLDGIVVSVPVDEGQTVNASQTTPTIVQIADLNRMELDIEISEGDIGVVQPGQTVLYTTLSDSGTERRAALDSIDPGPTTLTQGSYKNTASASSGSSSSSSSSSTSTAVYFYGKALIDNRDRHLRIGMTVQTAILIDHAEQVLLAPIMGIRQTKNQAFASVMLSNGIIEEKQVRTGISDGVRIQILSGLQEGDQIVTAQVTASELEDQKNRMPGPGGRRR
ncbi:MAG: efflux RND transporter periplasmic adaptor subunit [Desulfovibrionaceae bacterium]|nr:efflux RND transporter periplasmic adaptor subunit [Desulfovibrionaceae bacterium]